MPAGPFAYARRAFGPTGGFIAGFATLVEFVFAPPAIALAIGAYLNVQFPALDPKCVALGAYVVFIGAQLGRRRHRGDLRAVRHAARDLRAAASSWAWSRPGWSLANFVGARLGRQRRASAARRSPGIFAAIPFAIWFFLAIEGAAMAAEEARDPHRTIPIAYIAGILTLVVLAFGVMIFAGGVGDWRKLANINDPLPQAMKAVVGEQQRLAAHAGVDRPVRPDRLVPRHHHGLLAPDLRAGARRLPAGHLRRAEPALQHAAPRDAGRRRGRHRRDLQRRVGAVRRPDAHRQHRHHVGVRRDRDVPHLAWRRCSSCGAASRSWSARTARPSTRVFPAIALLLGAGVPGRDDLVQRHAGAAVRWC